MRFQVDSWASHMRKKTVFSLSLSFWLLGAFKDEHPEFFRNLHGIAESTSIINFFRTFFNVSLDQSNKYLSAFVHRRGSAFPPPNGIFLFAKFL